MNAEAIPAVTMLHAKMELPPFTVIVPEDGTDPFVMKVRHEDMQITGHSISFDTKGTFIVLKLFDFSV